MASHSVPEDDVNCSICYERFNTPKVLPCQHTYCVSCVTRLEQSNGRGNVQCPECREIHPVPANGFPINITMQRILSSIEMPNNPTINVPTQEPPEPRPHLAPTAPPIGELQSQYNQPNQPQHQQNYNSQMNHPSSQNASLSGDQRQNPQIYVPPPQLLPSIQTHGRRNIQQTHGRRDIQQAHGRRNTIHPSTSGNQAERTTDNGNSSEGEDNFDQCKTTSLKYFSLTRNGIRTVVSSFLRKHNNFMAVTTIIFMVITFTRFIAGAVKLSSDCPKEQRVAVYLFVKSCFGFFFWCVLIFLGCKKQRIEAMDNCCVEVWVYIESFFSLIWFILGNVWILGLRDEMIDECPFHVEEWNKHFINFALFLTVLDWIGIVAFGLYCCYAQLTKLENDD